MSTSAFGFDFSSLNPYVTGLMDRSMRAADYRLSQMPVEDSLNRRGYAEWLNNNASKRGIAEQDADLRKRGFEAERALQAEALKRAEQDRVKSDMEKRYAMTSPGRDLTYPGRGFAGQQWANTAQRMGKMTAAGIPIATYDPIDRMAAAGASGSADSVAGANARSGGCPPGYTASPFGGCQPAGTGWGARG